MKDIKCEHLFNTAEFYLSHNNKEAAVKYLNDIINSFPDTQRSAKAKERLA